MRNFVGFTRVVCMTKEIWRENLYLNFQKGFLQVPISDCLVNPHKNLSWK